MNILIIAAHPDDETLGAGGMIAKYAQNGDTVFVCIVADGVKGRWKDKSQSIIKQHYQCTKRACSILGVKKVYFLEFEDQKLDTYPLLEITKKIESLISKVNPAVIYTHYYGDLNLDHRVVFEAVMVASRPFSSKVKKICCYEIPSSTEWNAPHLSPFSPNVYENIENTFDLKLKALAEYSKTIFDEVKRFPYPRSEEAVTALAKVRGSAVGFQRSEAFVLIRDIKA